MSVSAILAATTIATGANSAEFSVNNHQRENSEVQFTLVANGTFSGTTLTIQVSHNGGTDWTNTAFTLTASGTVNCTAKAPLYRVAAAAGTGTGIKIGAF